MASRTARRTFVPVLLPGVAASALAAVAGARVWAHLDGATLAARLPLDRGTLETAGQVPLASALSLVCLAGWGALLVTRGRFRRVIATVGLVSALALLAVAVRAAWGAPDAVRRALGTQLGLGPDSPGSTPISLTGWFWVSLVATVVVVATFAAAIRFAAAWPAMGARYDAPGATPAATQPRTNLEIWKAIDEGHDPTG